MHRIKFVLMAFLLCLFNNVESQIHQPFFNFQAIARDHFDHPISLQQIKIQVQILSDKNATEILFEELHEVRTDEVGVFSIEIGNGKNNGGKFNTLNDLEWTQKQYFIKASIAILNDPSNTNINTNFDWIDLGITQLGVVPYAMYALKNANGFDTSYLKSKLNIIDTLSMLSPYAFKADIKSFATQMKNKVSQSDTAAMLSSYVKNFEMPFWLNNKLNSSDSLTKYVTPSMLQSYRFDTTSFVFAINKKLNTIDTASMLSGYLRKGSIVSFPGTIEFDSVLNTPTLFSGSYVDLTNKPFLFDGNYNNLSNKPSLFSGSYADLTNKPNLFDGNYNSLSNLPILFSGSYQDLTNKPFLFDGNYNNLSNKPSLFSGSYADLTNKPNLFDGNYNSLSNLPILFSGSYLDLTHQPVLFDGNYNSLSNKPSLFSGSYVDLTNKPNLFDGNYNSLMNLPDQSLKENVSNKSIDVVLDASSNTKYPSVNAVKTYVDAMVLAGAPDADGGTKGILKLAGDLTGSATIPRVANNSISTDKLLDGAVTDAKLATGISASKVGLGNVTNNAQLYSLNGLTSQVQTFNVPGYVGIAPNWVSSSASHTLNIPLASNANVTAGLISKSDYDKFVVSSNNRIEQLTTNGNAGTSSLSNNVLNIPNYTLAGLTGNVSPNSFFSGPINGTSGTASFRSIVAADIPDNNANTTGNASSATILATSRNINGVPFNGSNDITITANTPNTIQFDATGAGEASVVSFNGTVSKTISYNTIGAAPAQGSLNINTLGTITSGVWRGAVIGSNYGGAGAINGILKANGSGVVSLASSATDYQLPITSSEPLQFANNNLSINQSTSSSNGFLSSTDWNTFNNKISASEKGAANGVANLDANGKIATSMIPAISFSTGVVVSSESQMLGLSSAVTGTIAIRTDNNNNYVLSATPASVLSNWIQLAMPTSVQTINGVTGVNINLNTNNIAEGTTNKYFSNTLARNALSVVTPLVYDANAGIFSITASGASSAGYLTSADWNTFNNKQSVFGSQSQNLVYASPDGTSGAPLFRALVTNDIPLLNQNTSGTAANITASTNSSLQTLSALSSIGTITTGIWHGSIVNPQYGGTGINNGTKTISLGGNLTTAGTFTTAGNYSVTMTSTANTSINLPSTGTLATIAGSESLTKKNN